MTCIPVHSVDSAPAGRVQASAWRSALAAGWSEAELTETSVVVALNLFTNYFNHLVQTDLDLPAAPAI